MDKLLLKELSLIVVKHNSLCKELSEASVIKDRTKFISLSKEYSKLDVIVSLFNEYKKIDEEIQSLQMLFDTDKSMQTLISDEINLLIIKCKNIDSKLHKFFLPSYNDCSCIFLEIRAASGGKEASIFVKDLLKMYVSYVEVNNWKYEIINYSLSSNDGYKDVIIRLIGSNIYSFLKFESGIHRVQRVPKTESQGRVHTSTCTVAVLPEVNKIDNVEINSNDLRIDTYRASGAGGQHVNRTDSAVRITHLPTSLVAECQDERSQHKNKAKAMSLLKSRLLSKTKAEQKNNIDNKRRSLIGTGDRADKIRTYNYLQNRVTDHRINLTLYKLLDIMNGGLYSLLEQLTKLNNN